MKYVDQTTGKSHFPHQKPQSTAFFIVRFQVPSVGQVHPTITAETTNLNPYTIDKG